MALLDRTCLFFFLVVFAGLLGSMVLTPRTRGRLDSFCCWVAGRCCGSRCCCSRCSRRCMFCNFVCCLLLIDDISFLLLRGGIFNTGSKGVLMSINAID